MFVGHATAETWLGHPHSGVEAVIGVAVSKSERLAVLQRFRRKGAKVEFGPLEWLAPHQVDDEYFTLLPSRRESFTAEEAEALVLIFAEGGELPAQRLN